MDQHALFFHSKFSNFIILISGNIVCRTQIATVPRFSHYLNHDLVMIKAEFRVFNQSDGKLDRKISIADWPAPAIVSSFDRMSFMSHNPHANLAQVAQKFGNLRSQLYAQFPGSQIEAERLAKNIVDCETANAETIWSVLWDKPLYTNRETSESQRYVAALSPEMAGSWQSMTGKLSPYHIIRKSRKDWADKVGKTNGSFEVFGRVVERWQDEIGLAYQVAFPIVNAGIALNGRSKISETPFKDIASVPLEVLVPSLQKELKWGWGHTTVLHFLTDLGLGMKTDRHLVRSTRYIGLHNYVDDELDEKESIVLNIMVRDLCREYFGSDSGCNLRTMDKNLMDISANGIIK